MTKRLVQLRAAAAQRQRRLCWYCAAKMLSAGEGQSGARRAMICTAEHLVPRSEGGRDQAENIVAACLFCNRHRHIKRVPLPASAFHSRLGLEFRSEQADGPIPYGAKDYG